MAKPVSDSVRERILGVSENLPRVLRSSLREAPYNPRFITGAARRKLRRSLEKYGVAEPLIFNKRTRWLVGGHQRLSVLDEMFGYPDPLADYEIPVSIIDMNEAKEMELNLALNNPEMSGEYDLELLGDVITGINETGGNFEDAGFSSASIHMMLGDEFGPDAFKDQAENESDILDELGAMREIGVAAEKDRKATAAESASDGNESAAGSDAESPRSSLADAVPSMPDEAPISEGKNEDHKDYDFGKRRREYQNQVNASGVSSDSMLTVAFGSSDELLAFMRYYELSENDRCFSIAEFCEATGLEFRKLMQGETQ